MEIQKISQLVALRSPTMDRIATTPAISVGRVVLLFLLMITYETCSAIGGRWCAPPSPLSVNIAQILQYDAYRVSVPLIITIMSDALSGSWDKPKHRLPGGVGATPLRHPGYEKCTPIGVPRAAYRAVISDESDESDESDSARDTWYTLRKPA